MRLQPFDSHTGEPLSGVELVRGYDDLVGATDAGGELVFALLEGQESDLQLTRPGYAECSWNFQAVDVASITTLRIPMRRLGYIDGRLTDEDGTPVTDAHIYVSNEAHPFGRFTLASEEMVELGLPGYVSYEASSESSVSSDAQGRFSMPVIPDPGPYLLSGGSSRFVGIRSGTVSVREPGERAWLDIVSRGAPPCVVWCATTASLGRPERCTTCTRTAIRWSLAHRREGQLPREERRPGQDRDRSARRGRWLPEDLDADRARRRSRARCTCATSPGRGARPRSAASSWRPTASRCPTRRSTRCGHRRPETTGSSRAGRGTTAASRSSSRGIAATPYARLAGRRTTRSRDVPAGAEDVELVLPEYGSVAFRPVDAETGEIVAVSQSNLWGSAGAGAAPRCTRTRGVRRRSTA